jgi:diadenosine tetraphosphate (Ap4A) HIT family hydrolase
VIPLRIGFGAHTLSWMCDGSLAVHVSVHASGKSACRGER